MVAPRGEGQVQVGIKVPKKTVDEIDALVEAKEYGSRSLFIKEAIDRLLNRDRTREETRDAIRDELRSGAYDDIIEQRVRKALGRVVSGDDEQQKD